MKDYCHNHKCCHFFFFEIIHSLPLTLLKSIFTRNLQTLNIFNFKLLLIAREKMFKVWNFHFYTSWYLKSLLNGWTFQNLCVPCTHVSALSLSRWNNVARENIEMFILWKFSIIYLDIIRRVISLNCIKIQWSEKCLFEMKPPESFISNRTLVVVHASKIGMILSLYSNSKINW